MFVFGRGLLGAALPDLHPLPVFHEVEAKFMRVVAEPACARFSGKLLRMGEHDFFGERIMLPIGDDRGCATGVLGASCYDGSLLRGEHGKAEFNFGPMDWCSV